MKKSLIMAVIGMSVGMHGCDRSVIDFPILKDSGQIKSNSKRSKFKKRTRNNKRK